MLPPPRNGSANRRPRQRCCGMPLASNAKMSGASLRLPPMYPGRALDSCLISLIISTEKEHYESAGTTGRGRGIQQVARPPGRCGLRRSDQGGNRERGGEDRRREGFWEDG